MQGLGLRQVSSITVLHDGSGATCAISFKLGYQLFRDLLAAQQRIWTVMAASAKPSTEKTAGDVHFRAGRYHEAISKYTAAIKAGDSSDPVYLNRAQAYVRTHALVLDLAESCSTAKNERMERGRNRRDDCTKPKA